MIVNRNVQPLNVMKDRWPILLGATLYAALIVYLYLHGNTWVDVPLAIPAMLGTVLSILLGFRTAAAYERWWEARKIWGSIVNDSRTFARQVIVLIQRDEGAPPTALHQELVHRQIAWAYALSRSLRRQDALADVGSLLDKAEVERLRAENNVPNALLMTQGMRVRDAYQEGLLNAYFLISIEDTLRRLTDHMGKCERIKNTVFPGIYSYFMSRAVLLFFLLLPSGLAPFLEWFTVPVALVIELLFSLIEMTGKILQDPFENRPSDTPMMAISRTIEIDLRQQLGDTELPEPLLPINGVLM